MVAQPSLNISCKKEQIKKQEEKVEKSVKNNSNLIIILVIVIILLVFVALYLFLQLDKMKRAEKEKYCSSSEKICNEENVDWILDNCECVERNIRTCPEGFELHGKMCRKDNEVTSSLLECSKYKCESFIDIEK